MQVKAALSTKLAVAGLTLLLAFMANIKYKQYKNAKAIEAEKQKLIDQADKWEKKNKDLNETLSLLTSKDYKERVARQQYNMKKDGELVYNFQESKTPSSTPAALESTQQTGAKQSNTLAWWNYFFQDN